MPPQADGIRCPACDRWTGHRVINVENLRARKRRYRRCVCGENFVTEERIVPKGTTRA